MSISRNVAFIALALFAAATAITNETLAQPGRGTVGPRPVTGQRPTVAERTLPPSRPTPTAQKIAVLKNAGFLATPNQLGTPFRLDMLVPSVAGKGWLSVLHPHITIHRPGGYAVAHMPTRRHEGPTTLRPAVSLMLTSDYQNNQLIDCQIYQPAGTQTWRMDFRLPNDPHLAYAPPTTIQVNAPYAISHLFLVAQKVKPGEGPTGGGERQIELSASDGQTETALWSFLNCEITPFS